MGFKVFYYKGFSFIVGRSELFVFRNGNLISMHPINTNIMDDYDIVEIMEEMLEM